MNETQMQYFCKVAEPGHISNAAKELFISQPTLTATIRRIEDECGFPLFTRKGRNIVLTKEGKTVYDSVRRVLAEQQELQRIIRSCRAQSKPVVEIVSPPHVITSDIIKKIAASDCQISLQISRIIDVTALSRFYNGEADFLIQAQEPSIVECYSDIVDRDEFVLAVHADSCFYGRKTVSISELSNEIFAGYPEKDIIRGIFERSCEAVGFSPKIIFEATSANDLMQAVNTGICCAVVPKRMTQEKIPPEVGICRLCGSPPAVLKIYWRKKQRLSLQAKTVKNIIIQHYCERQTAT